MKRRDHLARYIVLGAFFIITALIFLTRLINIEVAGQDYYVESNGDNTYTRYISIQAQRGNIYDRNGKLLVYNVYTNDIELEGGSIGQGTQKNDMVLRILDTAKAVGEFDKFTEPEHPFVYSGGKWQLDEDFMNTVFGKRMNALMIDLNFIPDENEDEEDESVRWTNTDIGKVRDTLLLRYGIIDEEGECQYPDDDWILLFKIRLDMELKYFSPVQPYTILKDVSDKLIATLSEGSTRGFTVTKQAERRYGVAGVASHILGRTGKITAENADYYTELGYSLDSVVGTSGAEQAFEQYLHGTDGTLAIVEDGSGNVIDQYVLEEPVPGCDVYLTIDINFQREAEKALRDNIAMIVENAKEKDEKLVGEDANAGALTVIDKKTSAVYALATYPTFDLTTFNEDYDKLLKDENSPLFFRALDGTYAPGSTFKPGVAVAALSEGLITPTTEIEDKGQYTFYEDSSWQPRCWIYSPAYGMQTHGMVNVSKAIQVSCNYFFYDIGRQLTIAKIQEYCRGYGLGAPTGIELSEKTGVLAGPDEREANGNTWYDGDTLAAAIGQSDHLFTPLQISCYIATVLNNGTRYGAHLLNEVRTYGGEVVYTAEPTILDSVKLDDDAVKTVKYAMKDVTENGSAARVFQGYPIVIGGKTGTAQVSKTSSDNAIFTAFAPFDDPQIVATCVIEHGAGGTDAGFAIRDVFSAYFGLTKADDGKDKKDDKPQDGDTQDDTNG